MKKKTLWAYAGYLLLFFVVVMVENSLAGVVIEQAMRDREGRTARVVLYVSEERIRTDDEGNKLTTILDFKSDRMAMIDHGSKSFVEFKFSQWEKELAQRLQQETPRVPSKQRRIEVRKTGEMAIINGFRTEKIEVLADGALMEENWMTREADLAEIGKVMDRVARGFSTEFRQEMNEGREIYDKLKPLGLPILVKDYTITYGLGVIVQEVKKLEHKKLKEEVFLPPQGYKRIIVEPSGK